MKSLGNESTPNLATHEECTGCLACVDSCRQHALRPYIGEDGHRYVAINRDQCIGCRKCEKVCLSSRSNYGVNDTQKSDVYAAWSTNTEDRARATSGGVFSAVARKILENNGSVVGAVLDGRECRHILIQDVNDIALLQGSKYMESSMDGIYGIIERELSKGPVLFSGVGCQCGGVLAYFKNHRYKNNLFTMDLVCGGVPSKILLDKFYEKNTDIEQIISFRDKDKYRLQVTVDDKVVSIDKKNLPLHGFNCGMTNRLSCYRCQFACVHRRTDFTIGDLWDYSVFPEEHSKGISTLIIHSEKGRHLVDGACIELFPMKWENSLISCRRIACGRSHVFRPRKDLVKNAKRLSCERFIKLYCIAMRPTDVSLFIFRVYRYLLNKIHHWLIDKEIRRIIKKSDD